MLKALILADDLSGAADSGVAFTRAGLSTIVSLGDAASETAAEVLAIDADTRRRHAGEAVKVVDQLIHRYAADKNPLFFKKIDSTLRGHLGLELAAALHTWRSLHPGRAVAICAPAFPAIGRTTVNGTQWMHGDPLHETELWRMHGLTHAAHIPQILQSAGLQIGLISLHALRSAASNAMNHAARTADVLVCDAETEDDLQAVVEAALQLECKPLFVGSAGLAHHLPRAAGLALPAPRLRRSLSPLSGPLLYVIGSLSQNSLAQQQALISSPSLFHLLVPPATLLAGEGSPSWVSYQQQLEQAIAHQKDVLLAPESKVQVEGKDKQRLSRSLARMTVSVSNQAGALVAAGGETARNVLECWNVTGLRLLGEVEKGVPVAVTDQWTRSLPVITKAGDFGQPGTLLHCGALLRGIQGDLA